ncbi:unnamed protein product [Didymodactylos carnosus]|uniref:Uncharacterized protein n=1 Tax=Didymodactylos carnosus TaxID=1234261 RepID=A0A815LAS2_9BILA|nr:unnamed protein product [Didymodactylos carnosus]CAF1400908.1 unnamed protein product [Didymodactylos carnosus]CAF3780252.1 unnamed protein product [Didymodactylos carnosus]CAF4294783.1 unnamed protein product [Didymodactylos carnosus]
MTDFWNDLKSVTPSYCICGDHDSPAFQKQNEEFGKKLQNGYRNVEIDVTSDGDHFNAIEQLRSEDDPLTLKLLNVM